MLCLTRRICCLSAPVPRPQAGSLRQGGSVCNAYTHTHTCLHGSAHSKDNYVHIYPAPQTRPSLRPSLSPSPAPGGHSKCTLAHRHVNINISSNSNNSSKVYLLLSSLRVKRKHGNALSIWFNEPQWPSQEGRVQCAGEAKEAKSLWLQVWQGKEGEA